MEGVIGTKVENVKIRGGFFQTKVLRIFSQFGQIGSLEFQRKDTFYFQNA